MEITPFVITKWVLMFSMAVILGIVQDNYAKANFPNSRSWKLVLLAMGFVFGTIIFWGAWPPFSGLSTIGHDLLISALVGGPIVALISLYATPRKIKCSMPKKDQ
jgi:hypothetical protein